PLDSRSIISIIRPPPSSPPFPYTTLFRSHYKYTDMHGEDGNFEAKKKAIEELDAALPILFQKRPDVLAITGDHSTPVACKAHSRSEEHTSELQSRENLVCRLLLEKKNMYI